MMVGKGGVHMIGGYKFGRFGAANTESGAAAMEWILLIGVYAGIAWLITRLLVRLGRIQPQNETAAWFKVMGVGAMAIIVLLILLDEYLI